MDKPYAGVNGIDARLRGLGKTLLMRRNKRPELQRLSDVNLHTKKKIHDQTGASPPRAAALLLVVQAENYQLSRHNSKVSPSFCHHVPLGKGCSAFMNTTFNLSEYVH